MATSMCLMLGLTSACTIANKTKDRSAFEIGCAVLGEYFPYDICSEDPINVNNYSRHEVGDDLDFGFVIPIATEPEPEETIEEELPDASPLPPPPTTSRPTPNTSAKRIHLDRDGVAQSSPSMGPSPSRSPRPPRSVYSIPDGTSTERSASLPPRSPASVRAQGSSLRHMTRPPASDEVEEAENEEDHDVTMHDSQPEPEAVEEDVDMEDAPPAPYPRSVQRTAQKQRGPLSSVIAATKRITIHTSPEEPTPTVEEVVMESPADAPGSGKRQRTILLDRNSPVVGSSTLLHKVLEDLDETTQQNPGGIPASSSPVERRVRTRIRKSAEMRKMSESMSMRGSTMSVTSPTSSRGKRRSPRLRSSSVVEGEENAAEDVDVPDAVEEEEPEEEEEVVVEEEEEGEREPEAEESAVLGADDDDVADAPEPEPELPEPKPEAVEEPEEKEAEEIENGEGGRRWPVQHSNSSLSRKVRTGKQPPKPQLPQHSSPAQPSPAQPSPAQPSPAQPSPRQPSPRPPTRRSQSKVQEKSKPKPKQQAKKPPAKRKPRTNSDDAEGKDFGDKVSGSVPITVQRFSKPHIDPETEADDLDDDEIQFSHRGPGVHILDVLSKLCDEMAENYMGKLRAAEEAAEDAATRREKKVMLRALEAFHRELMTKLLDHTIALDQLHGLRKRVKAVQKEKIAMRDEIMRVRAEREQVALRMDAIRMKHEVESREALRHISLSSAMHDIDLAVEKAQAAPELSAAEQKKADLANFELLVSRVADQASSKSDGGGTLKQIKEFNAFLERAAAAMEKRR
ncbi:uncharacterized protein PODANS_1_6660 [Podospora anserina S mat+]|uniref:Podospora anserina S mat+ genomic DNA chromosome 1, supercontig 1 n=1 Tax=Podospora anserina (strain S / ATCC MYA-4624 / DSM 980 / FGSC 10383) TaxID=515849 RepID=B2ABA4_PODAN|nr:uncharacterized protein PODANS_1_6660 [Podospora anserina S mat+]CAP60366.1 unnamed protein product [Podospora anserina S mat+]